MAKEKKMLELKNTKVEESTIDLEKIKLELRNYVDERVQQSFLNEIDKANRKLLREKNRRLFIKSIIIVLLFLLCGFLTYLLINNGYFDQYFNHQKNVSTKVEDKVDDIKKSDKKEEQEPVKEPEKEVKPTQDELKKEYAYLLDNYVINDKSIYLSELAKGNLTNELKKYYVLNHMDFSTLTSEEETNMIYEDTFALAYSKMFNDECSHASFDYDGIKIKYINSLKTYISDALLTKNVSNIKREITKIEVENDKVTIETMEGIVINDTLYDVISKEEIGSLFDKNLNDYSHYLLKIKYTFEKGKLIDLAKIID